MNVEPSKAVFQSPSDVRRLVIAILIPLAASGLQGLFWTTLQPYAWLLFYPAVFFSSWIGGRRGGFLATVLSTVLVWYFFIPPRFTFAIEKPSAFVSIGIFVGMGIVFTYFHERLGRANQQAAAAARRESKNQFGAIFEQAAVGMAQVGLDGRWLLVNQRLCDIVGYSREELLAKTFQDITHADDLKTDLALVGQVLAGELTTYTLEKRYVRKDRSVVSVNLTVSLMRDTLGQPKYFIAVVEDITERKQAEAALRASDGRMRLATEATGVGIWEWNVLTNKIRWDAQMFRIYGVTPTPDGLVDYSTWSGSVLPEELAQQEAILQDTARRGGRNSREFHILRRDDRECRQIEAVETVRRNDQGQAEWVVGTNLDVTERKQAEVAIRESEERFRTLVEMAPEAIFIQTAGRFAYVNAAALRLFGATQPAELVGQPVLSRVHPDYQAGVLERIHTLNEKHQRADSEDTVFLTWDGSERHVMTSGVPFHYQNQNGALVFAVDLTRRKLAEAALSASQGKLKAALASMTDAVFISDAAGQFVEFNDAFATFHRFKNKAECATTFAEYPDILEVFLPNGELAPVEMWAVPRALRGETVTDAEYTLRRKDTGETWVGSYSFAPIRDPSGTIIGSVVTGRDITERKRAEQALRERTALLRVAGRIARFGGWSVNLAEGQVLWSEEVAAIHETPPGFSPSAADGINFYAPEWREKISTAFDACVRDGKPYDEEMQIITARGQRVWVRTIGEAVRGPAGAIVGVQGAFQDITERKLAEAVLQRSEARRTLALDAAQAGTWEWDLATNQNIWSDELWKLYGLEPHSCEPSYEAWRERMHPEERERVEQKLREVVQQEAELTLEWRVKDSGSGSRWLMSRGRPLRDASGRAIRYQGVVMDITQIKQTEAALRESEAQFRTLANAMPQLAWIAKADGFIFWYNQRWYDYTGTTPEQMEGWGWQSVHDPAVLPQVMENWTNCIASGQPFEMEFPLRGADGQFHTFLTRGYPLKDSSGRVMQWFGTNTDVEAMKLAEEKIKLTMADLERSNKELEHFAFVASHDLQEPLRMVASYTQLLAQQYERQLDEKAKKYIRYAVEGAVRMQTLINDLLTYSRVGRHGKPLQPTDAHAVLGEAIRNLAAAIADTHAVITSEDLPTVLADASQLLQLFQNLLANAIKFQRGQPPFVHVSARREGDRWRFAVKDNGIGIEPQYAERVFIIFQRLHTREEYPGTGIGLAVCQRIVDRHGGKIWFESPPGKGTTFFFTLPAIQTNTPNPIKPTL